MLKTIALVLVLILVVLAGYVATRPADSRPAQSVTIRLEFLKPFAATNTAQFDFAPTGSGTKVTWAMNGHNNVMAKAFSAFMDMDKMVGADFKKGLASLDTATATRRQ
jgi:hypothetical protein